MQTSEVERYKTDNTRLRDEVNEWKKKYFDCRRKVVAQAQYVRTSLPRFTIDTHILSILQSRVSRLVAFYPGTTPWANVTPIVWPKTYPSGMIIPSINAGVCVNVGFSTLFYSSTYCLHPLCCPYISVIMCFSDEIQANNAQKPVFRGIIYYIIPTSSGRGAVPVPHWGTEVLHPTHFPLHPSYCILDENLAYSSMSFL